VVSSFLCVLKVRHGRGEQSSLGGTLPLIFRGTLLDIAQCLKNCATNFKGVRTAKKRPKLKKEIVHSPKKEDPKDERRKQTK
jgi:hypothetical protein